MSRVAWVAVLGGLLLGGSAVLAEPYWFAFEFDDPNDLPQGEGWVRRYQPQPFGVVEDGVLTYDSNDPQSYDFWQYSRPGALDPGPNEIFVGEWRLWTEWVTYFGDPDLAIMSDEAWVVDFAFNVDVIHSIHEYVDMPLPWGGWHDYTLISADMRSYEFYIDGILARQGWFAHRFLTSLLQWGDAVQGVASRHHWDYFRFGVVPAPEIQIGDLNCDGEVGLADINPFIQALIDPSGHQASYPGCPLENGDINGDGSVDFFDINPFVDLLSS